MSVRVAVGRECSGGVGGTWTPMAGSCVATPLTLQCEPPAEFGPEATAPLAGVSIEADVWWQWRC